MMVSRNIARIYALFANLAVLLLATTMPPMQNADETAHAFRADQVSRLHFAGEVLANGEYGGDVSSGLRRLQQALRALVTCHFRCGPTASFPRLDSCSLFAFIPGVSVFRPFATGAITTR
jgi:hypothetical protein